MRSISTRVSPWAKNPPDTSVGATATTLPATSATSWLSVFGATVPWATTVMRTVSIRAGMVRTTGMSSCRDAVSSSGPVPTMSAESARPAMTTASGPA